MEFIKANVNLVEHIWPEEPTDTRWRHARFMLFQLWGMMDGYNYAAKHFKVHTLSLVDFFLLNSMSEISTMMTAYEPQKISDRAKAQSLAASLRYRPVHCVCIVYFSKDRLRDTTFIFAHWHSTIGISLY